MKQELRRTYRLVRKTISRDRSLKKLFEQTAPYSRILSYAPIGSEVDVGPLNVLLQSEGRLLLPPPDPQVVSADLILVPALAYDADGYRLGQGGGYYDRLLALNPSIPALGVAYGEQLHPVSLPRDPWDRPVQSIIWILQKDRCSDSC